jgi:hypothetical protein
MAGSIDKFNKHCMPFIRGSSYKLETGYVIKMARENLSSHFSSQTKSLTMDLDGLTQEYSLEQLLYITANLVEYKVVLNLIKKNTLKVNFNLT